MGAIKFAIGQLAKLGNGKVVLGENTYSIEGEAASPEAFADILATNSHTLPASLTVEKADVAPPNASPYRFVVESGPAQVTLVGYAPSDKDKQMILDAAHRKFGSVEIVDKLGFASGAPASFVAAATGAFGAVARLAGGRAEIVDNSLSIEGGAYYPAAADEIASTAADGLPEGFAATTSITLLQTGQPLPPQRCRDLLQNELQKGRIEFSGNKADIAADSLGLLDRVAAVFARCPAVKVEVGAHSDSDGSTSKNRDLTQARAEAIVDYLVDAGVERERLNAVGYGEDKPVADNSTKSGKAANRRIDFTVKLPGDG
jgi:OOP family OmpA-OmpF porin